MTHENRLKSYVIERTVKVDAGGYPHIDLESIELYDYDKDECLAKEGQKALVIIILED